MITIETFTYRFLPGPPCRICYDVSILLSMQGALVTVVVHEEHMLSWQQECILQRMYSYQTACVETVGTGEK